MGKVAKKGRLMYSLLQNIHTSSGPASASDVVLAASASGVEE